MSDLLNDNVVSKRVINSGHYVIITVNDNFVIYLKNKDALSE